VGWWNGSRLLFLGLGDGSKSSSRFGEQSAGMRGVSCTSVHFCEAVGFTLAGSGLTAAEAITWNGRRWGRPTGPPAQWFELSAVSCVAAGDCVALDGGNNDTGNPNAFDRLSAGRWESDKHDPGVGQINANGSANDQVNAVWCRSLASCVTVGVQRNDGALVGPIAAAGDL